MTISSTQIKNIMAISPTQTKDLQKQYLDEYANLPLKELIALRSELLKESFDFEKQKIIGTNVASVKLSAVNYLLDINGVRPEPTNVDDIQLNPESTQNTSFFNHPRVLLGVPVLFFAFSKFKKYDNPKTIKVTLIGSAVVIGAIVLNGFSGAWTGETYLDRVFGKKQPTAPSKNKNTQTNITQLDI